MDIKEQNIQRPIRCEYVAPQLVEYGSVSDLTASGSQGGGEGVPGQGQNRVHNYP